MKRIAIGGLLFFVTACGGAAGTNGTNGANGSRGVTGATGPTGAAGMTISSSLYCSKTDSGSGTTLYYQYSSVIYTTGDRYVDCSVSDDAKEYTGSFLFSSTQAGAASGGCSVTYGLGTTDFGFWGFTSQSGTTKVVYTDTGSAKNGYTYTFVSGDCTSL